MGIKKVRTELPVLTLSDTPWLGKWFLFQTFEELDSVKDKEAEVQQIRQLLEEDNSTSTEAQVMARA